LIVQKGMGLYVASCLPSYCLAASFSGTLPRDMRDFGRVAEMRDDGSNSYTIRLCEKKDAGHKLVSVTSLSCMHPRG
jgi:hypothetical protein